MPNPRLASSLAQLRQQIDALAPGRDKSSDGWIGDEAHRRRRSEHNPDESGVVRAIDITHDPRSGVDIRALAESLRATKDPRIDYVIANRQIFSSSVEPWAWRHYGGANPHTYHLHISVVADAARYDAADAWAIKLAAPDPNAQARLRRHIRQGDSGSEVIEAQQLLRVAVSGVFDAELTEVVCRFQAAHDLEVDGIIGPYTWEVLLASSPPVLVERRRQSGITATVFGGDEEDERSAYDGHRIGSREYGVALPFRFKGTRPRVKVFNPRGARQVVCDIVDVGPWNIDDPYWATGARPQAETGLDHRGRHTNRAGIDLTVAAADALGIDGKGTVDWEFLEGAFAAAQGEGRTTTAPGREGKVTSQTTGTRPEGPAPAIEAAKLAHAIEQLSALVKALAHPASPAGEAAPASTPAKPALSPIDKILGGEALVGLKTPIAIIAYVILLLLQYGGAVSGTSTSSEVMTALIAGLGGLGVTAKIDRGIQILGTLATALKTLQGVLPKGGGTSGSQSP